MQKANPQKTVKQPQQQSLPGSELKMKPRPVADDESKQGTARLAGKIAFITGGDSGIGKAVAILFAKEGADLAISYLSEDEDAMETYRIITDVYKRECLLLPGDISKEKTCNAIISKAVRKYGRIDILINNAAVQYENDSLEEIDSAEMIRTFETNIFAMIWITKAALPFMKEGCSIINTTSVTAYRGSAKLIPYSSTKGAIVSFTRSLSASLSAKKIRVNAVAPGPVWTPLIVASFKPSKVKKHGSDTPLERPAEPVEIAPSYLFLASDDGSYITGQVLHPNGGEIVNG
jgi:NAD(P)-dependent dehydrogenase (short-subunit alcohol dehydrogenase family)